MDEEMSRKKKVAQSFECTESNAHNEETYIPRHSTRYLIFLFN